MKNEVKTMITKLALEEIERMSAAKMAERERGRKDSQRRYILGGILLKYFPALKQITPGESEEENDEKFLFIDAFVRVLSEDSALCSKLKEDAETVIVEEEELWEDIV